jgi:hypothetical protein
VITKRAFAATLPGLDVSLENDLRLRRNLEIDRAALHELGPAPGQHAGQHQFVEAFWHRRRGAVLQHGVRAEGHGHFQALPHPLGHAVVLRAAFVPLPVHARGAAVVHLHAIRPDVPHAGFGIAGNHQRQGDERAAVLGQVVSTGSSSRPPSVFTIS